MRITTELNSYEKKKNTTNSLNNTSIPIMPLKTVRKHSSGGKQNRNRLTKLCLSNFCYRRKTEVNIPFWIATTVLFQEAKLDSTSYSSPSHLWSPFLSVSLLNHVVYLPSSLAYEAFPGNQQADSLGTQSENYLLWPENMDKNTSSNFKIDIIYYLTNEVKWNLPQVQ